MPEGLTNYILQERPIQPAVDLGIVTQSLATINQGNKEALQTQSALRTAIAEMDLNEAEDGFRQALYDDITKTIDDNSIAGNTYYALDDIIKKQGDIGSNPALLGRLKAQAAYKQYRNQIDARNDINEDTKAWAKDMNPYHYEDKVDESGKVIGGSEWLPTITPVEDIDLNKVYTIASQYIIPKTSHWDNTTFVDADGNESKTYIPGKTVATLSHTTGKRTEVTREMVENAINMAINANPEIEASMKQSFEVAKYKYNKGDTQQNLAYDNTGKLKSYNQYRNDLIDPYINQMIRCETQSSTSWNSSGLQLMYKENAKAQQGAGFGAGSGVIDPMAAIQLGTSDMGVPILLDKDIFGSSIGKINQGKALLAQGLRVNPNEVPDTYEDYVKLAVNNKDISPDFLSFAKDFYDVYGAEIVNNNNRANSNSELDAASIVEQYLSQNIPLNQLSGTNPYIQKYIDKYNTYIDNMFQDSQYIKFTPKDINKVIQSDDDKKRLQDLGVEISNGSLILSKDNDNALYSFMAVINGQKGNIYRGDFDNWNKLNKSLGRRAIESLSFGTGGNRIDAMTPHQRFDYFHDTSQSFVNSSFELKEDIASVYRQSGINQLKSGDNKILVGTGELGTFTVRDMIANQILRETGEAKYKNIAERAKTDVVTLFRSGNIVDREVYQVIQGDNGELYYKELDRAEKLKIHDELIGIKDSDIEGNLSYIQGYEFKQGITYGRQQYDKDGKKVPIINKIQLVLGTNQNDPELDALNNSDMIRAGQELMGSYINGESLNIGKVGNSYITIQGLPNPNDIKYSDMYAINVGGDNLTIVNSTDGISLLNAYRTAISDRNILSKNGTTEEILASYVKNNPFVYETYKNFFGEQTAFEILSSIMLK